MNEQTEVASGATTVSTDTAAATPTASEVPLSDDQTWASLEAKAETEKAPAPDGATPSLEDLVPPEVEPATAEEDLAAAGKAVEAKPGSEKTEEETWATGAPLEKLSPEQKVFLKANPGIKDAVYRDKAYHDNGVTVKLAEAIGDANLTSIDRVQSAVQAVQAIDALNADFVAGTPQATIKLLAGLAEENSEAASRFLDNLTSPEVLLSIAPEKFYSLRGQLLDDVLANTRARIKEFMDNDADAIAAVDSMESLLKDLSTRVGTAAPGRGHATDPVTQAKLQELDSIKRTQARSFGQTANKEIDNGLVSLIKEEFEKLTPKGFDPEVRNDLVGKIRTQLNERLVSDPFFRRGRDAIIQDRTKSLDERRSALVKFITKEAGKQLGRVAKNVVTPYTRNAISTNKQTHEKRQALAVNREVGASVPAKTPVPVIRRDMSDADIWATLESRVAARRGG